VYTGLQVGGAGCLIICGVSDDSSPKGISP
jgi:hypothetical protein